MADVVIPVEDSTPVVEVAPEATPVAHQAPSSSVVHEVVADVESAVLSVEDAIHKLIAYVKDGRRSGDADVDAAIADVHAALAAK